MKTATRNQIVVAGNEYQGDYKKVLAICSAGVLRSPTAAHVLNKEYGFNTRSAGIMEDYALVPVTEALLVWADEIVCMEKEHYDLLPLGPLKDKRVITLGIADQYSYMDEELRGLILKAYKDAAVFEKAQED